MARTRYVPRYVIDANVALAFVLPEAHTDDAARVFDAAHENQARLIVPAFWRVECGKIVWKYARRRWLDADAARAAFDVLDALPVTSIDTAMLIDVALDIALACDLTMYDSLNVAAALYTEAALVTTDEKMSDGLRALLPELDVLSVSRFT